MESGSVRGSGWGAVALGVALGVAWGLLVTLLGVVIGGAGHGWVSAFLVSPASIAGAPLATAAWVKRGTGVGRALATMALLVAATADIALWARTGTEGFAYVAYTWDHAAGFLSAWAALWLGWQLIGLLSLFGRDRAGRAAGGAG